MSCLVPKLIVLQMTLFLAGFSWAIIIPQPVPIKNIGTTNLRRLTREAGYIFAGTVVAVQRTASPNTVPTIKITFHVDEALLGVSKGQTVTIREWAGVWDSGQTYRPGEHLLLFLYRPGKLGLTSTVEGTQGRFKLDPKGLLILTQEQILRLFPDRFLPIYSPRNRQIDMNEFTHAIHQMEEE